jgi:hypothetical protein
MSLGWTRRTLRRAKALLDGCKEISREGRRPRCMGSLALGVTRFRIASAEAPVPSTAMASLPPASPVVLDGVLSEEKLDELLALGTEYAELDFKSSIDPSRTKNIVEMTKDIGENQARSATSWSASTAEACRPMVSRAWTAVCSMRTAGQAAEVPAGTPRRPHRDVHHGWQPHPCSSMPARCCQASIALLSQPEVDDASGRSPRLETALGRSTGSAAQGSPREGGRV